MTFAYIPLATKFYLAKWLSNMNNPKSQWPWPPWEPVLNHGLTALDFSPDERTQPASCSTEICSSDDFAPQNHAWSHACVLLRRILYEGKRKHARFKRATHSQLLLKCIIPTMCCNPFEGCLQFVLKNDHLRTNALMSKALSFSHSPARPGVRLSPRAGGPAWLQPQLLHLIAMTCPITMTDTTPRPPQPPPGALALSLAASPCPATGPEEDLGLPFQSTLRREASSGADEATQGVGHGGI